MQPHHQAARVTWLSHHPTTHHTELSLPFLFPPEVDLQVHQTWSPKRASSDACDNPPSGLQAQTLSNISQRQELHSLTSSACRFPVRPSKAIPRNNKGCTLPLPCVCSSPAYAPPHNNTAEQERLNSILPAPHVYRSPACRRPPPIVCHLPCSAWCRRCLTRTQTCGNRNMDRQGKATNMESKGGEVMLALQRLASQMPGHSHKHVEKAMWKSKALYHQALMHAQAIGPRQLTERTPSHSILSPSRAPEVMRHAD
eukprot:1158676-Pelagomonas_calceolata.AAC.5